MRIAVLKCLFLLAASALSGAVMGGEDEPEHPLDPALKLGREIERHILDEITDYTCTLVKVDRIDGELRDPEELRIRVRIPKEENGVVVQPFSVFVEYLSPRSVAGRKVLFIEGENNDKMIVKVGGLAPRFLQVKVYPDSDQALSASRYPVTDLGFQRLADTLLDRAEQSREADPDGENTEVTITPGVVVEDHSCTRIRVFRPERQEGLFHIVELYIDDALRVPRKMTGYDWPETPGGEPVLLESYTYTEMRLNVGLEDADFARSALR